MIEVDQFCGKEEGKTGSLDPTSSETLRETLKLIGAVKFVYSKDDDQKALACLLILEFPSLKVIYEDHHHEIQTDYPYIPGLLAFKEIPVYQVLFDRLRKNQPGMWPQVLLVDGNGILHTRQFGSACHIGV